LEKKVVFIDPMAHVHLRIFSRDIGNWQRSLTQRPDAR